MMRYVRPLSCLLVLASTRVSAQTAIFNVDGNSADMQRGRALAGGYDFDGDGYDDLVVGTPFADTGGKTDNGAVQVYSGRTGNVILNKFGDSSGDHFGFAVAICGDIDGDGIRDVIVGAPEAVQGGLAKGMARVFSGADSSTLQTWRGLADGDQFGYSVDGGFDTDNDNDADVIVGAPLGDNGVFVDAGYVSTYSGASGGLLFRELGTWGNGKLGKSVVALGDVDGDGQRDFAAGAPGYNTARGRLTVWDGQSTSASPTVLWTRDGGTANDEFGTSLAGQIDVDSDGFGDVLAGARGEANGILPAAGSLRVLSGVNGSQIRVLRGADPSDRLGASVAVLGNLNNVTGREIVVGASGACYARVFDPTSGEALITIQGSIGADQIGLAVCDAGDFDNDGVRDFAVGNYGYDVSGASNAGRASVYSSTPWFTTYCTSGTSSNGCVPQVGRNGTPSASASSGFLLTASGLEGQKTAMFFYGISGRQAVAWGASSSFLCVISPTQRCSALSTAGTSGACDGFVTFDWLAFRSANPGALGGALAPGQIVQAQCWYRDPPSPKTTQLSNAIEFATSP
ncbi:MAG: FG-GAP repeat protein [Planctomycetes bacterium]|nr:FG-GAP repeat protein [Planctomycetota bacterium]